jgi:hypothetical protein
VPAAGGTEAEPLDEALHHTGVLGDRVPVAGRGGGQPETGIVERQAPKLPFQTLHDMAIEERPCRVSMQPEKHRALDRIDVVHERPVYLDEAALEREQFIVHPRWSDGHPPNPFGCFPRRALRLPGGVMPAVRLLGRWNVRRGYRQNRLMWASCCSRRRRVAGTERPGKRAPRQAFPAQPSSRMAVDEQSPARVFPRRSPQSNHQAGVRCRAAATGSINSGQPPSKRSP